MPVHVPPTMSRNATDETTDALMDDHLPDLHQVLDSVQCSMVLVMQQHMMSRGAWLDTDLGGKSSTSMSLSSTKC